MLFRGLLFTVGLTLCATLALFYLEFSELVYLSRPVRPILLGILLLLQAATLTLLAGYAKLRHWSPRKEITHAGSLEATRQALESELEAVAARIDLQERKLADRFRAIHEWMDYPVMLDFQTGNQFPDQRIYRQGAEHTPATRQRSREDQQVREILDAQAELIYEKIRGNNYALEGRFQPLMLRDDLLDLASRIARVFQPELQQPLLNTTPEQLARALNRIGLHLLVVMDQLPLDLKSYNIQKTYETIRQAISTYGAYRKASPYLDWASKGLYFGRMVTSTNPIALGLVWGATELGKIGAKKLATHVIDRQAIGLLQSLVRVVGYEVAAIYGGDFRYRDANWCYAVELTHMQAAFPASRDSLQYALRELGGLQLRNEYDRLCAYRCLAAGKLLDRRQTHPDLLTEQERIQIVERLELAYREVLHGRVSPQAGKWQQGVQDHLGLHLSLQGEKPNRGEGQQASRDRQILNFLLAFLKELKSIPADRLAEQVEKFALFHTLGLHANPETYRGMLAGAIAELTEQPFVELIPPDLEPNDSRVEPFLETLCRLNAERAPLSTEAEQVLLETGLYYRRPFEQWATRILDAYRHVAASQIPVSAHAHARLAREACRDCARGLAFLQQEGQLQFADLVDLFPRVNVRFATGPSPPEIPDESYCLVVAVQGTWLMRVGGLETEPEIVWKADGHVLLENISSLITAEAKLSGGVTESTWAGPPIVEMTLQAPMTARYQPYFAELLNRFPGPLTTQT